MEKTELDHRIADMAKTLMSYCAARTANAFEAEDLAQDIIVEIYKSVGQLRCEDAFYGFLWAVAGNVYKGWCKKRAQRRECALTDDLAYELDHADHTDMYLLRRELSLLNARYRKSVVLYYVEQKSCSEISRMLSISESMVKYLLFKSRQILKEGMSMERNYGSQSYSPRGLSLMFWGNGANRYYHLCDSKISQNILFACYHSKLTAEQISLEIGVSLPYMEDKLNELAENDLLKREGNRYSTNIILFTKDLATEISLKTAAFQEKMAALLKQSVTEHEAEVNAIGFAGAPMNHAAYAWQATTFLLYQAVIEKLQSRIKLVYPRDQYGTECFIWGVETREQDERQSLFCFGISNVVNECGDYVQFMDFPLNGDMVHHDFYNRQDLTNVFLDIAKGKTEPFSENDRACVAELVRRGYVLSNEKGLQVNAPVFTAEQHREWKAIFDASAEAIAQEAARLMGAIERIIKDHSPVHLKKSAEAMAYLRLFEDAISAPVAILYEQQFLLPYRQNGILPTTYIILK